MAILERLHDDDGVIILGLLQEHVLYARFSGSVTTQLAQRFSRRFQSLVGDTAAVRYFGDYSALDSCDVAAIAILFDAFLDKRALLQLITLRPWPAPLTERVRTFFATMGCVELVSEAEEFDERLLAAVPNANLDLITLAHPAPKVSEDERTLPSSDTSRASPLLPGLGHYTYVFEFGDFERGRFTAIRHAHLAVRPPGTWVCVAHSDEQALGLARQAALFEWAIPRTRLPQDFTVRFLDPVQPTFDRRS